jgi:type I restriction enzyme R subunit
MVVDRKRKALQYKEYLQKVTELAKDVVDGGLSTSKYPASIKTAAQRALYDNLYCEEELALRIDKAVRENKPADFRGNKMKERKVKRAIESALNDSSEGKVRETAYDVEQIFKLVKAQREY